MVEGFVQHPAILQKTKTSHISIELTFRGRIKSSLNSPYQGLLF
jgi:hypothetical protein